MQLPSVRWLFVLVLFLPMSCRTVGSQNESSKVKDLPDIFLPREVTEYRRYSEAELDAFFASGTVPDKIPSGYSKGIHIIPESSQAEVPEGLKRITKILWKGKWFNPDGALMRDDFLGPDFGSARAVVSIEPIADVIKRNIMQGRDPRAAGDGKPSLITDYAATEYSGIWKEAVKATKGWIDEYRVVNPGDKPILLGRSTYNGRFWGYIVLQLDPSMGTDSTPIPSNPTREDLKKLSVDQWEELFRKGRADPSLIPSVDKPGQTLKGVGFPLIFQSLGFLNSFANRLWNGKNFTTTDGKTMIKNQFTQEAVPIQLFDAQVIMDKSRYDGKDIILIDYTVGGVPGIKAIRDEIRLVSEVVQNGKRRRLYLGPTYLNPEDLRLINWAARFQKVPFLWFSLELTDDAP